MTQLSTLSISRLPQLRWDSFELYLCSVIHKIVQLPLTAQTHTSHTNCLGAVWTLMERCYITGLFPKKKKKNQYKIIIKKNLKNFNFYIRTKGNNLH